MASNKKRGKAIPPVSPPPSQPRPVWYLLAGLVAVGAALLLMFGGRGPAPSEPVTGASTQTAQPAPSPPPPPDATPVPAAQPVRSAAPTAAAAPPLPAPVPAKGPLPPLPFVPYPPPRPIDVVRSVYEFAARHPEVLRYVPCYCGCENNGHVANDDCFVASRDAEGRVSWDDHGFG